MPSSQPSSHGRRHTTCLQASLQQPGFREEQRGAIWVRDLLGMPAWQSRLSIIFSRGVALAGTSSEL